MGDMEMDVDLPPDHSRTFRPAIAEKSHSGLRTFMWCLLAAIVSALVLIAIR